MRIPHFHHWSIRNFISTIPDTKIFGNIIMSSHTFYFGLIVVFLMKNRGASEDRTLDPWKWEADVLTTRPPGLCWRVFLKDIGKFMKTATSTQGRWDIRRSGQSFDTFWQLYHFRLDFVLIFRCHDKLILMSWKKYKWLHIALST